MNELDLLNRAAAEVKAELREHQPSDSNTLEFKPETYSDGGVAQIFLEHCNNVRWNENSNETKIERGFSVFDGTRWRYSTTAAEGLLQKFVREKMLPESRQSFIDSAAQLAAAKADVKQNLADETVLTKAAKREKDAKSYFSFAVNCDNSGRGASILKAARPNMIFDFKKYDAEPYGLNTPSGYYDLRTLEMTPHKPEHNCMKITDVDPDFNENNIAAVLRLLELASFDPKTGKSDDSWVKYVAAVLSSGVIGRVCWEILFQHFGKGANLKSTVIGMFAKVKGSYSGVIKSEELTQEKGSRFGLAGIEGRREIVFGEVEDSENTTASVKAFKDIARRDRLPIEIKGIQPYMVDPIHTAHIHLNKLFKIKVTDFGTERRLRVIPWQYTVTDSERIEDFAEQFYNQYAGAVLALQMKAAQRLINNGFKLPDCQRVTDATRGYITQADTVAKFIEDCCEVKAEYEVGSKVLYSRYVENTDRKVALTDREFKAAMLDKGYEYSRNKKGIMVSGVRLFIGQTDFRNFSTQNGDENVTDDEISEIFG